MWRAPAGLRCLLVTIALGAIGCGERRPPNVLLVTIDTLRTERTSAYGHARDTTPWLRELATAGVRFERAYASSSWTAPSVVSLLTGVGPTVHGVEHGHLKGRVIVEQEVIASALPYLPELLQRAGYRTFGITANTHLYGHFGFARGFDRYECLGFLDDDRVLETLARWRDEISGSEPWFVWLHLFDPHAGYQPREPWIDEYFPGWRPLWEPLRDVIVAGSYEDRGVTPGSHRYALVQALYDSEVRHVDESLQSAAAMLDLSTDELVVVTADHGEQFFEHGHFGHGVSLFEEVLRVPLVLRLPGRRHAGRVVDTPVGGIDVLPTVLDALELPIPPGLAGRSLLPLAAGRETEPVPLTASLSRFPYLGKDALIRGRWKLVQVRGSRERMLFDLASDPSEQVDLSLREPKRADEMEALLALQLARARERRVEPGAVELTPQELEQLESLGYVPK